MVIKPAIAPFFTALPSFCARAQHEANRSTGKPRGDADRKPAFIYLPFHKELPDCSQQKERGPQAAIPLEAHLVKIHPSDFSLVPRDTPLTSQVLLVETQWVPFAVLVQR